MLTKAELLDLAKRITEAHYLQLVKIDQQSSFGQRRWSKKLSVKDGKQLAKILTLWAEQMQEDKGDATGK